MRHSTPTITDSYGSFCILQFLAMTHPAALLKQKHWYVHAKGIKKFSWGFVLGVSYVQLRDCVSILTAPGSSSQIDKRMPTGMAGVDLGTSAYRRNLAGLMPYVLLRRPESRLTYNFDQVICNIFAKISLASLQCHFSCKYLPKERHIWRSK